MAIPEVNRLVNAYRAGAKEVNKNVKCKFQRLQRIDPDRARISSIVVAVSVA
jgi:basic membrane lipoprotein Med (substrate-binding protein (PBP1-ABC) superfamily)